MSFPERAQVESAMRSTNLWVSDLQVDAVVAAVERIVTTRQEHAAARLGAALQTISDEAVDADFQVGAAYALGVLAALADAAPGSTWLDVATTLVNSPAPT